MIVLDAGVLIGVFTDTHVHHDAALEFLEENDEFEFGASVVTAAECLVRPALAGDTARIVRGMRDLHLIQLPLAADESLAIAEVRAASRLRMHDAIVVHTAERMAAELATTDVAVARAAAARGIPTHLIAPS